VRECSIDSRGNLDEFATIVLENARSSRDTLGSPSWEMALPSA
jgi:hypothetical protein